MTARAVALVAALSVLVSVTPRVLALSGVALEPFTGTYGYSDVALLMVFYPFADLHWPYREFPFEYHPLIGWGTALASYVVNDLRVLEILWGVVVAAAAAAAAYLLVREVPRRRVLAFWSLSPQLLVYSGMNFDVLPTLGLIAASVATMRGRAILAGAAVGVGTTAKLFPIAALPLLALSLIARRRRYAALGAVFAGLAVLAALDGPAILAQYSLLEYGHHPYHLPSWNLDSIWLPFAVYASVALDADAIDRLVAAVSVIGLGVSYLWWCARPALRGEEPVPLFWRAVVLTLLWSRLYSAQYSLWVLPALALFAPRPGILALLTAGDLLTYGSILYAAGGSYANLLGPSSDRVAVGLLLGVLLRHAALLLLLRALLRPLGAAGATARLEARP